jgi:hypothetical protein
MSWIAASVADDERDTVLSQILPGVHVRQLQHLA